jgi:phage host-nuclease inhibitor protein Gam
MSDKKRIKRQVIRVPQDLEDAERFLRGIGQIGRRVDVMNALLNKEVEKCKADAAKHINLLLKEQKTLFEGLYAYAESHRLELTVCGNPKTVNVMTGSFGWRTTPPAVNITNVKKVLRKLKSLHLKKFIRTIQKIDKVAMLKSRKKASKVPGVKITQHEEFFAKPSDLGEVVAPTKRLKKLVS